MESKINVPAASKAVIITSSHSGIHEDQRAREPLREALALVSLTHEGGTSPLTKVTLGIF